MTIPRHRLIAIVVPAAVVVVLVSIGVALYFTVFQKHHKQDPFPLAPFVLPTLPAVPPYEPNPGIPNFSSPSFVEQTPISLPNKDATTVMFNISERDDFLVLVTKFPNKGNSVCLYSSDGQKYQFNTLRPLDPVNTFPHAIQTISFGGYGFFVVATKSRDTHDKFQGYVSVYVWNGDSTFDLVTTLTNPSGGFDEDEFGRSIQLIRTVNNTAKLFVSLARATKSAGYPEIREYNIDDQTLQVNMKTVISRGQAVTPDWGGNFCVLPSKEVILIHSTRGNDVGFFEIWQYDSGFWRNLQDNRLEYAGGSSPLNHFGPLIVADKSEKFLVVGSPSDGNHKSTKLEGSISLFMSEDSSLEWKLVQQYNFNKGVADLAFGASLSLTPKGRMIAVGSRKGKVFVFPIDQEISHALTKESMFASQFARDDIRNVQLLFRSSYNRIRLYVADQDQNLIRVWETHAFV